MSAETQLAATVREASRLITKEPGAAGHWMWSGPTNGKGYGSIAGELVSRALWEAEYGTPPRRLAPTCSERLCVKPDHRVASGTPTVPIPTASPIRLSRKAFQAPAEERAALRTYRPPERSETPLEGPRMALPAARASRWEQRT